MEDAHCHILSLGDDQTSFFAVYDGHGGEHSTRCVSGTASSMLTYCSVAAAGSTVARFAGSTLSDRLEATPTYQARDFSAALTRTFLATDEDLRANPDFIGDPSGCTAVAVIIDHRGKQIICVRPFFFLFPSVLSVSRRLLLSGRSLLLCSYCQRFCPVAVLDVTSSPPSLPFYFKNTPSQHRPTPETLAPFCRLRESASHCRTITSQPTSVRMNELLQEEVTCSLVESTVCFRSSDRLPCAVRFMLGLMTGY